MFRSDAVRLKFEVRDGMELVATGRVGLYFQRGKYQLYVTALRPLGQGDVLELAFQQLRARSSMPRGCLPRSGKSRCRHIRIASCS